MTDGRPIGALVIGGQHPGLGVARSLGRRGFPVFILDDQLSVSQFSRYVAKVIRVKDLRDERATIEALIDVGRRHRLQGWVLFPTRDEHVAAISRYRRELGEIYRVTTPDWETVKWAWDKANSYRLAETLGIPIPRTWILRDASELETLFDRLPLAIKPAIKENFFYATGAKAWRADSPDELRACYANAAGRIAASEVLIQEIIPGGGDQQFSFCAFCRRGQIHSSLVALRHRQHPREFGRAATYVETTENADVEKLGELFLRHIQFDGLVEIEFKLDARDGQYKLLDVNARTWGFHTLGVPAGVDFAYMLFADQLGLPVPAARGKPGIGWLRLATDVGTALSDMLSGHLDARRYVNSLVNTRVESVFSWRDPLPSAGEALLVPCLAAKEFWKVARAR
jgi:predicted ATP-grasp superfamily ATP-dependent carboligase